nr:TetR/AcrR family transcriptional regulator [Rhizobium wenxiniae]
MSSRTTQPRRLLPVAQQKDVIVSIASELFLERGFDAVTIGAVNAIAGGSRRDIYALFGDKSGLFARCVELLVAERAASLGPITPTDDLRSCLVSVGKRILDLFVDPRTLALHRLIVSDVAPLSDASRSFLVGGPQRVFDEVVLLLNYYENLDLIHVDNIEVSAKIFVGALTSDLQVRGLLGEVITEMEREEKVDATVEHFLYGVMPRLNVDREQRAKLGF